MRSRNARAYAEGRPKFLRSPHGQEACSADALSGKAREENLKFPNGGLLGVRGVDQILPDDRAEVTPNGPRCGRDRVRRTRQLAYTLDDALTVDDHHDDRTRQHE